MKEPINDLKTIRSYFNGTNNVSYRKFKKALNRISESEDPEALTVASSIQKIFMSDEVFEEIRVRLPSKAIDLEFAPAMVALAEFYYNDKNYEEAFKLYERAAKLNNAYALKVLAYTLKGGWDGVKKDTARAEAVIKEAKNGTIWGSSKGFNAERSDYE